MSDLASAIRQKMPEMYEIFRLKHSYTETHTKVYAVMNVFYALKKRFFNLIKVSKTDQKRLQMTYVQYSGNEG